MLPYTTIKWSSVLTFNCHYILLQALYFQPLCTRQGAWSENKEPEVCIMFERNYARATTDIDLLARRIKNSSEEMKNVFCAILSQDVEDALYYDLDSIDVEDITEFKEYHGLHISAMAYLDKTRIPIGIDIGFGDVIYPDVVKMYFPVILDMTPPTVNAYSLESSIAEKLEAIIHNGYLNSRYKDFYDIYILSLKNTFQYDNLSRAVKETFENRKTEITMDTAVFSDEFLNDPVHQKRWNAFVKKKKAILQVPMNEAFNYQYMAISISDFGEDGMYHS